MLMLDANVVSLISNDLLVSMATGLVSLVTGYILIRERILKTEIKLNTMTEYIDRKNELLEDKIKELHSDIQEFKELNKEMNKTLTDNTLAIRELRIVLDLIKQNLGVKGLRMMRDSMSDDF